ncbi:MAG: ion transporter [Sulfurimonas sp.]|nr:ion transporter [Sulfurimonas sp.]
MSSKIASFVESKNFQNFIIWLIVINAVILGVATSKNIMNSDYGYFVTLFDNIIIGIFTIEIILRIYVHRLSFFKDPWSLFDFFVVAISLIPANDGLSILRVLRVLRLFRLLTIVPQMRVIIAALIKVIPGIGSISMVVLLFFYVFSIMATHLFAEEFPIWFGDLGKSMFTLFQVMTLESWSMGIARPVIEVFPYAWIFFIIFILLVTFIMINLFIGIIVDAIFTIKEEDKKNNSDLKEQKEATIESLQIEVSELKVILQSIDKRIS